VSGESDKNGQFQDVSSKSKTVVESPPLSVTFHRCSGVWNSFLCVCVRDCSLWILTVLVLTCKCTRPETKKQTDFMLLF